MISIKWIQYDWYILNDIRSIYDIKYMSIIDIWLTWKLVSTNIVMINAVLCWVVQYGYDVLVSTILSWCAS